MLGKISGILLIVILILLLFSLDQEKQSAVSEYSKLDSEYSKLEQKYKKLERENETLKKENETLKNISNGLIPDSYGGINIPFKEKNTLKLGDKIQSSFRPMRKIEVKKKIQGSFSTDGELEDGLKSLANEEVFIFKPGGFATSDRYNYTSPTGATFHLDVNRRITKIEGTVYRQQK